MDYDAWLLSRAEIGDIPEDEEEDEETLASSCGRLCYDSPSAAGRAIHFLRKRGYGRSVRLKWCGACAAFHLIMQRRVVVA